MATATLSPAPKLQFFDAAGNPLVGGKLYSYAAGTTTPLATYTGNTTTTANPNPVVLNSRGEAGIWLSSSYYKLKLTDSNDVEIWTVDNVGGFATMADLTAAINALTASLAASGGSNLIGFIQAGAGAVATTAQTKMRETISVTDFGAIGNDAYDNTVSIQAAIDYANTIGGDVYFPPGVYRITNGLTINNSGDTSARVKASMYGDSSASVLIRGMPGAYDMLTITGGSTGAGPESHQVIRGLFFVKEDYVGFCIGGDNIAFLSVEDVCCYNAEYGFYATDVLSSVFYNCIFRQNKVGIRAQYTNFSYPNALTLVACVIGNCQDAGAWIIGGTNFNMFGGSVESNGLTGSAVSKFGVLLSNSGVQGAVSGNFSGVYFENNKGTADIWLANSAEPAAASISGCSFARLDSVNFTTNNILVETSGAGVVQAVNVAGCGFRFFNTYVPNSGRKYINAIATSSGVSTVAWSGCLFQSSTETPTIPNQIQLTGSGYVFPGWNTVTFQNSWADAGFPSPLCSYYIDSFGIVRLQGGAIRATNSSATIFTLPAGYRPTATLLIGSYGEITSVPSAVVFEIDSSGNVRMNATVSGNKVAFNSVSFSIY